MRAKLTIEHEFPAIKCNDCDMMFMLFFIESTYGTDNDEEFGSKDEFVATMQQGRVSYCPYCGEKQ